MNKDGPPDREPDVDTPSFALWRLSDEEREKTRNTAITLTVNADEGEEMLETRLYRASNGYELLFLSKTRPDGMVYTATKLTRPDKTAALTGSKGWLVKEDYEETIRTLEEQLSPVFEVDKAVITPGRHYMLYLKGKVQK